MCETGVIWSTVSIGVIRLWRHGCRGSDVEVTGWATLTEGEKN